MIKFFYKILCSLLLILALSSCQTNPISGRTQLLLISEDSAISMSKEAYFKILKPLKDEGKLDNNIETKKRIIDITEKIIAQAIFYRPETKTWQWSVHIIDDPETVNAWCMAGGRMAIYTGLIDKLKATDDEIAQVMGHEISHALLGHSAEKISRGLALRAGMTAIAFSQKDNENSNLAVQGAALAAVIALELPNSRMAESEADRIGIELAAKAGFNPNSAISLWKKMVKLQSSSRRNFEFLSTHPSPQTRIQNIKQIIPEVIDFYLDKSPRPKFSIQKDKLG